MDGGISPRRRVALPDYESVSGQTRVRSLSFSRRLTLGGPETWVVDGDQRVPAVAAGVSVDFGFPGVAEECV